MKKTTSYDYRRYGFRNKPLLSIYKDLENPFIEDVIKQLAYKLSQIVK